MATPAELADALFASPSTKARVDDLFSSRSQAESQPLEITSSAVAVKRRQHVGASLQVRTDGSVVVALRVSLNRPPATHDASAGLADALFASSPSPSTEARVDGLFSSRPQAESRPLCAEMAADVPYEAATQPAGAAATVSPRTQQADMRSDDAACSELHQLLFMVHGIGQHDDFVDGQFLSWDGTEGMAGGNMEFRQMLEALLGGKLREVPLWLAVQSVEWHAQLHRPEIDAMVAACSPEGVPELRGFVRDNVMDILYYSSAVNSQRIVDAISTQLNAKYTAFVAAHPGWRGRVNVLAHSLGSVIMLDMLSRAGTLFQGVRRTVIDSAVHHAMHYAMHHAMHHATPRAMHHAMHHATHRAIHHTTHCRAPGTLPCARLRGALLLCDGLARRLLPTLAPRRCRARRAGRAAPAHRVPHLLQHRQRRGPRVLPVRAARARRATSAGVAGRRCKRRAAGSPPKRHRAGRQGGRQRRRRRRRCEARAALLPAVCQGPRARRWPQRRRPTHQVHMHGRCMAHAW